MLVSVLLVSCRGASLDQADHDRVMHAKPLSDKEAYLHIAECFEGFGVIGMSSLVQSFLPNHLNF